MAKIFEPFKRLGKFDFDADSTFDSYEEALRYAQDPLSTAYFGQRVFVKSEMTVTGKTDDTSVTTATGKFGDVYTIKKKYTYDEATGEIVTDENNEYVFEWYLDRLVTVDNFVEALDESKDALVDLINGKISSDEFTEHVKDYSEHKEQYDEFLKNYNAHIEAYNAHKNDYTNFKSDITSFKENTNGMASQLLSISTRLDRLNKIMVFAGTFKTVPSITFVGEAGYPLNPQGYEEESIITHEGKQLPLIIGTVIACSTTGKEYVLDYVVDTEVNGEIIKTMDWVEFGDVTAENARIQALENLVAAVKAAKVDSITNTDNALKITETPIQDDDSNIIGKSYNIDVKLDDSVSPSKNGLEKVSASDGVAGGLRVRISDKSDNALKILKADENGNHSAGLYVAPPAEQHIPAYTIKKLETAVDDSLASYALYADGVAISDSTTINIPKDLIVREGCVVTFKTGDTLPAGVSTVGTYIKLVLNQIGDVDDGEPIYIPADSLIEYVTSGSDAAKDTVVIHVSADHKITATINDKTIAYEKLDAALLDRITALENASHTHDNATVLDKVTQTMVDDSHRPTRVYRVDSLTKITDPDLIKGDLAIVTANVDCETVSAINSTKKVEADWDATTAYTWDPTIDNGVGDDGEALPKGRWVAFSGNCSADNVIFSSDFVFTTKIGTMLTLSNGSATVPAAGKSITQFFSGLFAQEAYPGATAPSVAWNTQPTGTVEVGTEITPSYNAKLNAGSYTYGPATGITAKTWSVSIANTGETAKTTSSGSFSKFIATDGMSGYAKVTATASYDAGTVPVTNIGNQYPSKQIGAGSKSATAGGYTAYRAWFYGYKNGSNVKNIDDINSEYIRGLTSANGTFTSSMSTNKMQQMFFAAPAGVVKSVVVKDATNGAPQTVKQKTVYVTGAKSTTYPNGYTAPDTATVKETTNGGMAYDLFYVSNDNANSGDAKYNITVTKN